VGTGGFSNLESHKKSKDCVKPQVLMLDEIVTERRARYDDRTNMVVGVCREHANKVPLQLDMEDNLKMLVDGLKERDGHPPKAHLAAEAR
jgi:hypothetical protein